MTTNEKNKKQEAVFSNQTDIMTDGFYIHTTETDRQGANCMTVPIPGGKEPLTGVLRIAVDDHQELQTFREFCLEQNRAGTHSPYRIMAECYVSVEDELYKFDKVMTVDAIIAAYWLFEHVVLEWKTGRR